MRHCRFMMNIIKKEYRIIKPVKNTIQCISNYNKIDLYESKIRKISSKVIWKKGLRFFVIIPYDSISNSSLFVEDKGEKMKNNLLAINESLKDNFVSNKLTEIIKNNIILSMKNKIGYEMYSSEYLGHDNINNNDIEGIFKEIIEIFDTKHKYCIKPKVEKSLEFITFRSDEFILPVFNGKKIPEAFIYVAIGKKCPIYKDKELDMIVNHEDYFTDLIYFFIFGKNGQKLYKSIDRRIHKRINKLIDVRNNGTSSIEILTMMASDSPHNKADLNAFSIYVKKRFSDTLFYSDDLWGQITKYIDQVMESEELYEKKGIIHKASILLYGQPGTGKSTLIKVIASTYKRDVLNVPISVLGDIDLSYLASTITYLTSKPSSNKFVVVLEDIDTLVLDRNDDEMKSSKIMNDLLQFLDSNQSPQGVIFVATTNHIERLDEALLRDGRFDLKIEVKGVNKEDAFKMGKSFELSDDEILLCLNAYKKNHPDHQLYNQSSLQTYFIKMQKNKITDQFKNETI